MKCHDCGIQVGQTVCSCCKSLLCDNCLRRHRTTPKTDIEKCSFCGKEIPWYLYENHMDKHYEDGDFSDKETENQVAQLKEKI